MTRYAGKDRAATNFLKAVHFDTPEWTPCSVGLLPATWIEHREGLEEVVLAHPRIFPGFRKGQVDFDFADGFWLPTYELGRSTDCWGVVWDNIQRGCDGIVVEEPLRDWTAFDAWRTRLPDPMRDNWFGPRDWERTAQDLESARAAGHLVWAGPLMHGHFFMLLYYLRGFENLMEDMATDEPRLQTLIDDILAYNVPVIERMLGFDPDVLCFGEDLGMQSALPISPAMWRRWVKPAYRAMCGGALAREIPVYLHSDGHILEIIPDLIECGVRVLNPQIRANGLAGLQEMAVGKVCLDQDLDRQLFPFATPAEIDAHIEEVFDGLYRPDGGLMLKAECGPDVPLESIDAICTTLERLCKVPELV
jgi:hypothetical protein